MNLVLMRELMHELMTFVEFYELVHRHDMQSAPGDLKKQVDDDGKGEEDN